MPCAVATAAVAPAGVARQRVHGGAGLEQPALLQLHWGGLSARRHALALGTRLIQAGAGVLRWYVRVGRGWAGGFSV